MATSKARPTKKKTKKTLTQELSLLLAKVFLPDLATRARQPAVEQALRQRWQAERDHERTAATFDEWLPATVEQVGAAWILSCVFVRVLEDRGFLDRRRIAGEGADDSLQQFLEIAPALTERDYLLTVFRELATYPGAADVLDPSHNPAWRLSPSNDSVRALLDLLRETDGEGTLRFRFEREKTQDTRFLGDLYQDLSESVRKRHALLQTPGFVERFILDQTLEPAIQEFGLESVRVIDPTCGSGHFLLGAFHRLFEHRLRKAPGIDRREHAKAALAQVYGVDINPYAVAIARFRMTLAYLEHAGIERLALAPRIETNLVVADSLLHGAKDAQGLLSERAEDRAAWGDQMFALDDPEGARRLFGQRYHAVVGNPPYITCKDPVLREEYRQVYDSAAGKYALSAPFTERFFQLAQPGGYVGMINANSFTKREFGKALIEKVLPLLDLNEVIDTSGAYIPGHGTPTLLLFGRNRSPIADTVRAVMGKRGEPTTPIDPEKGHVWSAVARHHTEVGFENDHISVAKIPRETLNQHPWSLGGGGVAELKKLLEKKCEKRLSDLVDAIGIGTVTGDDDAFTCPSRVAERFDLASASAIARPLLTGEGVRDWSTETDLFALGFYDAAWSPKEPLAASNLYRRLWPLRTYLWSRAVFAGGTYRQAGRPWWEWHQHSKSRYRTPLTIVFPFVGTRNHFVLDRGGKVFKQTAPIVKLLPTATEDDHLAVLAYLNSSTACFWMKQVFMNKGATSDRGILQDDPDKFRFEFDGTKLASCPVPEGLASFRNGLLIDLARELTELGARLSSDEISRLLANGSVHSIEADLQNVLGARETARLRMAALQERIDWSIYEMVGLLDAVSEQVREVVDSISEVDPERRSFLSSGGFLGQVIQDSAELTLIERREFKRKWHRSAGKFSASSITDGDVVKSAAEALVLDLVEENVRVEASPISLRRLRSRIEGSRLQVACRLLGLESEDLVETLVRDQSIPWCGRFRFEESGWTNHLRWREVWDLQRREDGGESLEVAVPKPFGPADFASSAYWKLRGKLDVPKERFISYPGLERDDDKSLLVGWAGWNHLQRAQALAGIFHERKDEDGWPKERLIPILAGLLELIPWLKQWHNGPDPSYDGQRMGDVYEAFVSEKARALGATLEEVRDWRPADTRGGKRKAKAAKKTASDDTEIVEEAVES